MKTKEMTNLFGLVERMEALYRQEILSILTSMYWEKLERFEFSEIQKAFNAHIQNPSIGCFFPNPMHLVRLMEDAFKTKAKRAWSKVVEALTEADRFQSIAFDDALIHAVIEDMGGWNLLWETQEDARLQYSQAFQIRYCECSIKKPLKYPKYLGGVVDSADLNNDTPAKLLIMGDAAQAKRVMALGIAPLRSHKKISMPL